MTAPAHISVAGCARKVRYITKARAKAHLRWGQASHGGPAMNAFRCPHCGWWHVGHRPKGAA